MGGVAEISSLRLAFVVAALIGLGVAAGAGLLAPGATAAHSLRAAAARVIRRRSA